ncbi:MAG: adenylate/guanylate cyclase domain-containing protein [Acidimicrobiales bacterium]
MPSAVPPIKYVDAGGVEIAYQVIGSSGPTVVGIPGFAQNIELMWEEPRIARFLRRFGSFCRLIHFDKRGTGLSDRSAALASFPERVSDLQAVMDAEGVDQAYVSGFSEGGSMAAFFAATYPERCLGLLLLSTTTSFLQRDDYPDAFAPEIWTAFSEAWSQSWGTGEFSTNVFAPSMAGDPDYLQWMARYERNSLSPGGVLKLCRMNADIDVRAVLPAIRVPTVVVHRESECIPFGSGKYLAEHIPNARFVGLPGVDHLPWLGDADAILDVVEEFVTGHRPAVSVDRVLATVLFTDIVDSTKTASSLGDHAWHRLLDDHDDVTGRIIREASGHVVKSTGDGVLATFDSPSRAITATTHLHRELAGFGVRIRAGLHTGEVERRGSDVGGIGVNIAARIEGLAGSGETLTSSTVKDLCAGSGFRFEERGEHALKGVDGTWRVYRLGA